MVRYALVGVHTYELMQCWGNVKQSNYFDGMHPS